MFKLHGYHKKFLCACIECLLNTGVVLLQSYIALIFLLVLFVTLPPGAMGWNAVSGCGIS